MIKRRFACGLAIGAAALALGCGGGSGGGTGGAGMAGHPGSGGAAGQRGSGGTGTGGNAGAAGSAGAAGGTGGGNAGAGGGNAGADGGNGGVAGGGAGGLAGEPGTGGNAGGQSGAPGGHAGSTGGQGGGRGGQSGAAGGQSGGAGQGGIVIGGGGAGGGPAACQPGSLTFNPRAPTVVILVDLSGGEFTTATTGTFFNLRSAIEQTVSSLQSQVRFGLAAYVGDHASGACQLDYRSVPAALSNANAIKVLYDSLGPLQPFGAKADTPATEALPMVQSALAADTQAADRYVLFVTSGDTDFCDDSDPVCSADAVTYQLQAMYAGTPRIGSRVVGLPISTTTSGIEQTFLQNQANAGLGQPAVVPVASGQTGVTAQDVYYECEGEKNGGADSWSSLYTAKGLTTVTPLAAYGTPTASAPLYTAASTSVSDLQIAISAALSSMVSCTFDLSSDAVDTTKLAEASVTISGTMVPQSATNGWSMPSGTKLVLNGSACAALQAPGASILFQFPCDIITTSN